MVLVTVTEHSHYSHLHRLMTGCVKTPEYSSTAWRSQRCSKSNRITIKNLSCHNDSLAAWSSATSHRGLGVDSGLTGNGLLPPSQDDFFSFPWFACCSSQSRSAFSARSMSQRRDSGPSAPSLIGWSHLGEGVGQFFSRRGGVVVRFTCAPIRCELECRDSWSVVFAAAPSATSRMMQSLCVLLALSLLDAVYSNRDSIPVTGN